MTTCLARQLQGKPIVGIDGTDYGTLDNITMGVESGRISELVIRPEDRPPARIETDSDGRFRLPLDRIENIDDRIVIGPGDSASD
ncbi:photosystem reaction center protein H [Natronococcus sp. JC468]|uniref:PRC-barrel domain-containing protein n=1 Tax=Natronococcus sp. JC468 TaxID=1961921 RepID=UPI00143A4A1A|nr:PRC-barrel domain-containing protein [Natronococcus sp. JC468]NKE34979.1 photosystem reaction center protein H [Natronococcus sp. JC468]